MFFVHFSVVWVFMRFLVDLCFFYFSLLLIWLLADVGLLPQICICFLILGFVYSFFYTFLQQFLGEFG